MSGRLFHRQRQKTALPVIGLVALFFALTAPARSAFAHPLDIYLESTYITVGSNEIVLEINLTPGVLLAPGVLEELDTDGDGVISDAEGNAYVENILSQISLTVDGNAVELTVTRVDIPDYLTIQSGYGNFRIVTTTSLADGLTGTHTIGFSNGFSPTGASYMVNTFVASGAEITLGTQNRSSDQQSISVDFTSGAAAGASASTPQVADAQARGNRLLGYFDSPSLSTWQVMLACGLALLLGGLHALTPGHGKTLAAAYLTGSRSTVRQAALLGGIVTVTHTASVIAIGVIALLASHWLLPSLLVPALEIASGALVAVMGIRLIRQRYHLLRTPGTADFVHDHGDGRVHAHLPASNDTRPGGLLAMGISGGIIPCPEALGVMIVAVGLNRIGLGLVMIVGFSIGLAAVLIGLGIVLVKSRVLVERFGGFTSSGRLTRSLPLISAIVVTLLGIGIIYRGSSRWLPTPGTSVYLASGTIGGALLACFLATRGVRCRNAAKRAEEFLALLPPRYQDGHAVSNAPMTAADLVFDTRGQVAWDAIWGDFCDLALAGGPPHRDTMLHPEPPVGDQSTLYQRALQEIDRGLRMITGWTTIPTERGWIGLICPSADAARWLTTAITAERIDIKRDGEVIYLPVGAGFRLKYEIKNVVTAVAKTHHYWTEHAAVAS